MSHDHDRGLGHDLPRMLDRRRMFGLLTGSGLVTLAGCGGPGGPPGGGGGSMMQGVGGEIPQETSGPYPGDETNGPNVLAENGVVRQDIRSSSGSSVRHRDRCPAVDSHDGHRCRRCRAPRRSRLRSAL